MSTQTSSFDRMPVASVAHLVRAAAQKNGDRVALRAGAMTMSYRALEAAAGRLAGYLGSLGVSQETAIGVVLDRSFEQIVTILAIAQSGGAFIPLDPAWPEERLGNLLDDADALLVVGSGGRADRLAGRSRTVVDLDRVAGSVARFNPEPAIAEVAADDLAYIIYTSGSSGGPKGVEITHGNLANLISWHHEAFAVSPADHASHVAGLGFDASVWEVWPYLCIGASVSLPDDTVRRSPELLRRWLVDEQVTIAFLPTAFAEHMIAVKWPTHASLRWLLTGAETLRQFPPADLPFKLVNNYGPTECTVVATSGVVSSLPAPGVLPSIGRPIANTQVFLLDQNGNPVAEGEIGEIYIGGASVGRGYRRDPVQTAQRFVPDRFGKIPGARLYRTGDLGCRHPDGTIAFRGRLDTQIKIRGCRVEPDEISGALNRHPAVASSVVAARDEMRLAAYFVGNDVVVPSIQELRAFLSRSLPDYMIPSHFVRLASLPLTSNGKIDYAALPDPLVPRPDESALRVSVSPTERRLTNIVAVVSGASGVTPDDNFFLIGGHSLSGTQVVLRAREAFGVELTLRHLFEAKTVANLAATIERLALARLETISEEEACRILEEYS